MKRLVISLLASCLMSIAAQAQTIGGISTGGISVGGIQVGSQNIGGVNVGGVNVGGAHLSPDPDSSSSPSVDSEYLAHLTIGGREASRNPALVDAACSQWKVDVFGCRLRVVEYAVLNWNAEYFYENHLVTSFEAGLLYSICFPEFDSHNRWFGQNRQLYCFQRASRYSKSPELQTVYSKCWHNVFKSSSEPSGINIRFKIPELESCVQDHLISLITEPVQRKKMLKEK